MAATAEAKLGLAVNAATSLAILGMLMLPFSAWLTIVAICGNCDVISANPVTCAAADETAPPIPPLPATALLARPTAEETSTPAPARALEAAERAPAPALVAETRGAEVSNCWAEKFRQASRVSRRVGGGAGGVRPWGIGGARGAGRRRAVVRAYQSRGRQERSERGR